MIVCAEEAWLAGERVLPVPVHIFLFLRGCIDKADTSHYCSSSRLRRTPKTLHISRATEERLGRRHRARVGLRAQVMIN